MGRTQFGKKAEGKKAVGMEAPGKKAVREEQAFGTGIAKPKGGEGGVGRGRQERRQAMAMTLARGVWQQVAPTRQQQTAANSR